MTDPDPEFDAIGAELVTAGYVTVGTDGHETWTLTPQGEQIALRMSLSSEDDAAALLDGLLIGALNAVMSTRGPRG